MTTHQINTGLCKCDTCNSLLLDVGDEIYCPICDVGEHAMVDGKGHTKKCGCCDERLATWYALDICPSCYNKPASGVFKLNEKYWKVSKL